MKFDIKNLHLHYGDFHALKGIDMQIPENKVTAFIGPSGCGKSTFLKTLNRMNDLVEGCKIDGTVLLDGKNVYGDIEVNELRRRVGMVFQKPNPFPMSIYDNIAYGPRTHGIKAKSKLDEIVERSLKQAAIWDETKDRLKKNAVLSETLAACCILCVTIIIVYLSLSSHTKSSILDVDIGSSAEVGSSISNTSGSTASALAIQSLCC